MGGKLYRITDATAARMLEGFRRGKTPRMFSVAPARLEAYLLTHPDYAAEARPLIDANAEAARHRKGSRLRDQTHCKNGHSLADAYVSQQWGYIKRNCKTCILLRNAKGFVAKPEQIARARSALENGVSVNQIIHGRPSGGGPVNRSLIILCPGAFYRLRREDPEFNSLAQNSIEKRRGNPIALVAPDTYRYDWVPGDDRVIEAMLPRWLADRADVVNDIMVALLEGRLDRSQVAAYVGTFARLRCTMFPTKKARFAGGALLSLDGAVSDGENRTYAEIVKDGLWD